MDVDTAVTEVAAAVGLAEGEAGIRDILAALLSAEPGDAFSADPERLWPVVLRRQGGELAYVATYPVDPALN